MKAHVKKKLQQQLHKRALKAGLANTADGKMVPKDQLADNSMKRDYYSKG